MLPVLAPEMDKIADELMGMINSAGIRVGVTLRPQIVTHNPLWNASVAANKPPWPYFQRELVLPDGKTPDEDAITANLMAKATCAIKRWNASVFYVDSTGHPLVSVWDAMRKAFPSVIFIPEQSDWAIDYSTVTPLQDNWGGAPIGVNPMIKAIWPQAYVSLRRQESHPVLDTTLYRHTRITSNHTHRSISQCRNPLATCLCISHIHGSIHILHRASYIYCSIHVLLRTSYQQIQLPADADGHQ